MLDRDQTVKALTSLRNALRARLDDETRDPQMTAEYAESTLTQILGDLVTPEPEHLCKVCQAAGTRKLAVGLVTETGEGVCKEHVLPHLLAGLAVSMPVNVLHSLKI